MKQTPPHIIFKKPCFQILTVFTLVIQVKYSGSARKNLVSEHPWDAQKGVLYRSWPFIITRMDVISGTRKQRLYFRGMSWRARNTFVILRNLLCIRISYHSDCTIMMMVVRAKIVHYKSKVCLQIKLEGPLCLSKTKKIKGESFLLQQLFL